LSLSRSLSLVSPALLRSQRCMLSLSSSPWQYGACPCSGSRRAASLFLPCYCCRVHCPIVRCLPCSDPIAPMCEAQRAYSYLNAPLCHPAICSFTLSALFACLSSSPIHSFYSLLHWNAGSWRLLLLGPTLQCRYMPRFLAPSPYPPSLYLSKQLQLTAICFFQIHGRVLVA